MNEMRSRRLTKIALNLLTIHSASTKLAINLAFGSAGDYSYRALRTATGVVITASSSNPIMSRSLWVDETGVVRGHAGAGGVAKTAYCTVQVAMACQPVLLASFPSRAAR